MICISARLARDIIGYILPVAAARERANNDFIEDGINGDAVAGDKKVTSMKAPKLLAAAFAAFVALAAASPEVQAHGRVRGGVTLHFGHYWPGYWWGPGYWGPRYVLPPYGYYPPAYGPPIVAPQDPPVYIEREAPAEAAAPAWWYWCPDAKAYYPYVKECPGGWQRVPPQPPDKR